MQSFETLSKQFTEYFNVRHFPTEPASLYDADEYFLSLGGKRVRPVMCLMGNELFDDINPDAWPVAAAIELFHNFTLIDDQGSGKVASHMVGETRQYLQPHPMVHRQLDRAGL